MLNWTLVGAPGVGPSREREIWAAGGWDGEALEGVLGHLGLKGLRADALLSHRINLNNALEQHDFERIHDLLPRRERWRLTPWVLDAAAFVDIETDAPGDITAIAIRTREAATCWLRGSRRPPAFELLESARALVSFNGCAFDVPRLKAQWPGLRIPHIHLDLLASARRLRLSGGLKALEVLAGWTRAPQVAQLRGGDAVTLWARWLGGRDRHALQLLCEYNLEDVWGLPALAAFLHDRLASRARSAAPGAPQFATAARVWHLRSEAGPLILRAVADAVQDAESAALEPASAFSFAGP